MKLISLNIWGGRVFEPFKEFIFKYAKDIDIFCLQEVFDNSPGVISVLHSGAHYEVKYNIFSLLKDWLPEHNGFIHPRQDNEESNAIFIKKAIGTTKVDEIYLYGSRNSMGSTNRADFPVTFPVNMEYTKFVNNNSAFMVCNIHGYWTPDGKKDNPIRIEQSKKIIDFFANIEGGKIICGDFNLLPETQSIKMLEDEGLRNLIKEYNISSTRTSYYTGDSKFADYCFVSPNVKVIDFKVLPDVVSDHSPLFLEFE